MSNKRTKPIPKQKIKAVNDFKKLIDDSRSTMIVSIKNLPAKQFQLIVKKLRGQAKIKVPKKSIIGRALEKVENEEAKSLEQYIKADIALLFSNLDPFELSLVLSKNRSKTRAKPGQEVDEDVFIEEGPTELIPGPVVSQLGNLGIKFAIEEGKISIQERKKIVEEGEEADKEAADLMAKLEITPISVGFEPLVAYDKEDNKIYKDIKIDIEDTKKNLVSSHSKSLAFSVSVSYICKGNIKHLLSKALSHELALDKFVKSDSKKKKEKEKSEEENKEEEKPKKDDGKESEKGEKNQKQDEEKDDAQENKQNQEEK